MPILLAASLHTRAEQAPLLAAASSLRTAWPAIVQQYTADTGQAAPRPSFGSSGLLSTQILNGAPFDIFLSADRASIDRLPATRLERTARTFALGELHLVVTADGPLAHQPVLSAVAIALKKTQPNIPPRLAIANPQHAPYGRAAREALLNAGLWPLPAQQLLQAENAVQTLQFVQSGAAIAAIVPHSLLKQHRGAVVSQALPAHSYSLVRHTIAVLDTGNRSALGFHDWLLSEQSASVLSAAGLQAVTP